ncbi:MAG: NAD(P)H-dependent oxidoreductase subunit E [Verrucomicrobiota bacterium]
MIQAIETAETFELSADTLAKIDKLVPRYPSKRSATLPLLHLIQDEKGYISKAATEWIAARLDLEPIHVYELVTFYPMFREEPIGKHHVKVCRTLSCALNGADSVCQKFKREFGVELDDVSTDGLVTVEYVECIASCGTAPVVQINEKLHENVTEERASDLISQIKAGAEELV